MAATGTEYAFAEWESCRSWPLNAERQVSDRLLPDSAHSANGRIGREARIGDPAAFKVEQPVEWQQPEQTDSPVVADFCPMADDTVPNIGNCRIHEADLQVRWNDGLDLGYSFSSCTT